MFYSSVTKLSAVLQAVINQIPDRHSVMNIALIFDAEHGVDGIAMLFDYGKF